MFIVPLKYWVMLSGYYRYYVIVRICYDIIRFYYYTIINRRRKAGKKGSLHDYFRFAGAERLPGAPGAGGEAGAARRTRRRGVGAGGAGALGGAGAAGAGIRRRRRTMGACPEGPDGEHAEPLRPVGPAFFKILRRKDQQILDLQKSLNALKQQLWNCQRNFRRAKAKWGIVKKAFRHGRKNAKKPDQFHVGVGAKRAHVSKYGGVTLALMRSLLNEAAQKVAAGQNTNCSHQSVVRWERKTDAGLVAAAQSWHSENELALQDDAALDKALQWCVEAVRSDATNRKLLHKEALQVCVADSLHSTVDPDTGQRQTDRAEWWSDVLRVQGHAAQDCHSRILKQLENIGVVHWMTEA